MHYLDCNVHQKATHLCLMLVYKILQRFQVHQCHNMHYQDQSMLKVPFRYILEPNGGI
jgi:hypothetical protein